MEKRRRVAVVAGTPVDTKMGVDYLARRSAEAGAPPLELISLPAADNCDAQWELQYGSQERKREVMDALFDPEHAKGTEDFFIYCNSLSGAFDFDAYASEKGIRICTPLQVYRRLAGDYRCLGVVAANNLSVHAIEDALVSNKPELTVVGSGNMTVVRAIEREEAPEAIVESCGLLFMVEYMKASGAEALILGCTHFPYFKEVLASRSALPLIDPADEMYANLLS